MGFSYYILRAIHYLLEQLKGRLEEHSFVQLLHYLFFLPTLFVGPINRFDSFLRSERRRRWDPDQFSWGLMRIVFGFAKIVVIAYYLVNRKMGFWIPTLDQDNLALLQYIDCWQYALNLYFQFSGYCDVAIGVSALLGFRITENFHYPFLQPNIAEFWRNWHMSLTAWSREYVYPPVAAATRSPYLAIFAAMLFIGLWHEFSAKYLLWGLYHGGGIMLHRYYQRSPVSRIGIDNMLYRRGMRVAATLVTLHFVVIGFILTKEDSLLDSWVAFKQLAGL
jgi:alginate O-acetyltransferase complex protein AlgI